MSYPLSDSSVIVNIVEEPTENTKIIDLYKTYNTYNNNISNNDSNKIQNYCEYEIECKYCSIPIYCINLIIFITIITIMLISKYS